MINFYGCENLINLGELISGFLFGIFVSYLCYLNWIKYPEKTDKEII